MSETPVDGTTESTMGSTAPQGNVPMGTPDMQSGPDPYTHRVYGIETAIESEPIETEFEPDRPLSVVELAESFRDDLKYIENRARYFAKMGIKLNSDGLHDVGETIAQAMLALRHIEDARMRFGKVIQYATTGESLYQK